MSQHRYLTEREVQWLNSGARTAPPAMTRSQFFSLCPADRMTFALAGVSPTNDPTPERAPLQAGAMRRSEWNMLPHAEQGTVIRRGVTLAD
jgi:hypothetical protein